MFLLALAEAAPTTITSMRLVGPTRHTGER
jgi:hypothetical protein